MRGTKALTQPRVLFLVIFLTFLGYAFLQFGHQKPGFNPPIPGHSYQVKKPNHSGIDCDIDLPNTHFCFQGVVYLLQKDNAKKIYGGLIHAIPPPPDHKTIFAPIKPGLKLEVVLIELKPAVQDRLIPTLYNIAHIYGGTSVGFTVIYNGFHHAKIKPIKEKWSNVRWIKIDGPFSIHDYNTMLTSIEFFDQFHSRFMLLTHTDSLIYRSIDEDFFDYDFIGPPWPTGWCGKGKPAVGNAGYCLRNISFMKSVVASHRWDNKTPEDLWWCRRTKNLPPEEVAERWGTTGRFYNGIPTGSHRLWVFGVWNNSGHYLRTFAKNNLIPLN